MSAAGTGPDPLTTPDTAAMAAICGAFLAQDFADKSTSYSAIAVRAKAILLSLEGATLAPSVAGLRVKEALSALLAAGAFRFPPNDYGPCTLVAAAFPLALRRHLGLPDLPHPPPTPPEPLPPPPAPPPIDLGFSLSDW